MSTGRYHVGHENSAAQQNKLNT